MRPRGRRRPLPEGLTEQPLTAAKTRRAALTGPGGLLTWLAGQALQTALETALSERLGHERGDTLTGGTVRNGYLLKTVRTEIGPVMLKVPA